MLSKHTKDKNSQAVTKSGKESSHFGANTFSENKEYFKVIFFHTHLITDD